MKKLFLILAFTASIFASNAQTKEETISWLTEKLKKGAYSNSSKLNSFLFDTETCTLTVNGKDTDYKGETSYLTVVIPLSGLKLIFGDYHKNGYFQNKGIKIHEIASYGGDFNYIKATTEGYLYINTDIEDDILNRMQKAFDHLATFCPQKKETF